VILRPKDAVSIAEKEGNEDDVRGDAERTPQSAQRKGLVVHGNDVLLMRSLSARGRYPAEPVQFAWLQMIGVLNEERPGGIIPLPNLNETGDPNGPPAVVRSLLSKLRVLI
jgi:hypothetical protein